MGAENLIGVVVALALGVTAASLAPSRAQATEDIPAPAPHYQIVDECGGRFVELDAQPQPTEMIWGEFGAPIGSYYGVVAYAHGHDGDFSSRHGRCGCRHIGCRGQPRLGPARQQSGAPRA